MKKSFTYEEVVQKQIENMGKFLDEIQVPDGWIVQFEGSDEIASENIFVYIIVKDDKDMEWKFSFIIELYAIENKGYLCLYELVFYVDDYAVKIEGDAMEETDFSKLLARYDELAKIFREVEKNKKEVK